MKLYNGIGKPVSHNLKEIQREAGFETGLTSIVTFSGPRHDVSLSQHESGEWDVAVDEENVWTSADGEAATKEFWKLACLYSQS